MSMLLSVQCIDGLHDEIVYDIKNFPYSQFLFSETCTKHKVDYLNVACAFDIETTNIRVDKGGYAYMYHWQFCMHDKVIFGRTWEEFVMLIDTLNQKLQLSPRRKLVIYVHNLAFEFQFMRRFVNITSCFMTKARKIIKCDTDTMEFRCSYHLSNMNLAKFCENSEGVLHYKLTDTYDYNKIRTPATELTKEEKGYCYNDVRGLCECIEYLLQEDTITSIPLTNTGYVRREYREAMKKNPNNRQKFLQTRLDDNLYILLKNAFRGGDTHANRYHVGDVIENVHSYDIQSSYPAWMMMEKYPIGKFLKCKPEKVLRSENYAWVGYLKLEGNVRYKGKCQNPYIPKSKCLKLSPWHVNDNGRILAADEIVIAVTDIDFKIIRKEYEFEHMYLTNTYMTTYGYLPKEFRDKLLEYYTQKTQLKGIDGKEYEYMKSKNRVNSSYGMMVTDIAKGEFIYNPADGTFIQEEVSIQDLLDKYYNSRNSFLSYQHGVWVTAHARYHLRNMMEKIGNDVIYCDTDSIKFIGNHDIIFENENKKIIRIAEEMGAYAYDKKGNKRYLGIWEHEKTAEKFKTLGAKKYIYTVDGVMHCTIAGVSKTKGSEFFAEHGFDSFSIGTSIKPSGHLTATYNDDEIHTITVDGCTFTTASNVCLLEGEYTLGVTKEYAELLGIPLTDLIS